MAPALPRARPLPGRAVDDRIPAEAGYLGAHASGRRNLALHRPQPICLVEARMPPMVDRMAVVPTGLGDQDRLAVAPPGFEQRLEQARPRGMGVIVDADHIDPDRAHQTIRGGELPLADAGDRIGGQDAHVGMVLARHPRQADGEWTKVVLKPGLD